MDYILSCSHIDVFLMRSLALYHHQSLRVEPLEPLVQILLQKHLAQCQWHAQVIEFVLQLNVVELWK